ncbi:hypothetical protein [Methanorbis furvi]|uniref:hypothetical protein n=1 Tax=Methanorbis furvi TaxID=3028299 RepID=UPI0030B8954E
MTGGIVVASADMFFIGSTPAATADSGELYEFLASGMTKQQIAERVGCSEGAVRSAIRNHGLVRPFVRDKKSKDD